MSFSAADYDYMAQALRLAEKGLYTTKPNPRVGCIIVLNDKIVGSGWHQRAGDAHAEVFALQQAGNQASGATVYITLEPCSHYGRTPPCVNQLINAKVARVVVAMDDPNPRVAGSGIAALRAAGIQVECGLLEEQALELNPGFVTRMVQQKPWVRLKIAASLDGKTALHNGVSKWITGSDARHDVHRLRARSCALLTGIGTVLADDPMLNVRLESAQVSEMRPPLRVVLDSQLRISLQAKILQDGNTLIFASQAASEKIEKLQDMGIEVQLISATDGKIDLSRVLHELAKREINEVTVEAGPILSGAFLQAGLVDQLIIYLAPVLLGDKARGMLGLPAFQKMEESTAVQIKNITFVGQDIKLDVRLGSNAVKTPAARA